MPLAISHTTADAEITGILDSGYVVTTDWQRDLVPLFERLCPVDLAAVPEGHATRTVIEHLGCYLIVHGRGAVRLLGPRSSAASLVHALQVAAASLG